MPQPMERRKGGKGEGGGMDEASKRLKAVVERRHPDHVANCADWCFFRQAVIGGGAYANEGNLYKHPKEDSHIYAARLKRAADNHFNITELVLTTYLGYLFQRAPSEHADAPEEVKRFIKRADSKGRTLAAFARDVAAEVATTGPAYLCVDKPPTPDGPDVPRGPDGEPAPTAAQEADAGLFPYVYIIRPECLLDGKREGAGFAWALVQEDYRDDESPWTSTGEQRTRWRLWEKHQWTVIEEVRDPKTGKVTAYTATTTPNKLGRVPIVPIHYREGTELAAKGLLADIARLDRACFNKTSLQDEVHYQVTFPQLAVPFNGPLFDAGGRTAEGHAILTVGLDTVLPFHAESGAPQYVAPPAGPSEALGASVAQIAALALALALLDGEVAAPGSKGDAGDKGAKAAASGVSRAYVFEKLNKRLADLADRLESGFEAVFDLVLAWYGKTREAAKAEERVCWWDWPDTFEVRSLAQDVADAVAVQAAGVSSPTFLTIIRQALVRKALPKQDDATLQKIDREIESGAKDDALMAGHGDHEAEEGPDEDDEEGQDVAKGKAPSRAPQRPGMKPAPQTK